MTLIDIDYRINVIEETKTNAQLKENAMKKKIFYQATVRTNNSNRETQDGLSATDFKARF